MAVPKQRHTKSRRNKRRSHHALDKQHFSSCPKCGSPVLSHRVCQNCGSYKSREVIDVMAKLTKKERKLRKKELAAQEQDSGKDLNMENLSKK